MNNEVIKILRLVEKGIITKEQGYILIKAHYENASNDLGLAPESAEPLAGAQEEAIESSAELIEELLDAARSSPEDWAQLSDYSQALEGFVRGVIDHASSTLDDSDELEDSNNFIKKDFYLAGEKVYDQRNVSLKSIKRGKKYKANFFVFEIKDSAGECIEDKRARSAALELIDEGFCGRYRKIKNGNVVKIYIE